MADGAILFDLQGAQSTDFRDRGVARYVVELALALERRAPTTVVAYLLNPDLALPGRIEPLVACGKLRFSDEPGVFAPGAMLHVASPFELSVPIARLLPPRGTRTCVTVFDLIQLAMPETYLEDAGQRRRYLARVELVRAASGVLTISDHVAADVEARLGVDRRRIVSTPLVPSSSFRPPASRDAALRAATAAVPGLRPGFVLCTGGSDGRKNLEGLLQGWARLPDALRRSRQLVIAGSLPPLHRNHLEVMAASSGFGDALLCSGFVTEETLVALNQSAALLVFPSLAEGFGLPIAEAQACGTPAIGGDNTAMVEVLAPEARFDASSPSAIAEAIARALTDDRHRAHLVASRPPRTWDDIADETIAAYARFSSSSRGPDRRARREGRAGERARLAIASPLPPQPGGVARYSRELVAALAARDDADVDVYVDGPPHHWDAVLAPDVPDGVTARPLAALERVEALEGPYDAVVYSLGNSEFHTGSLATLLRRPGVVLAHDVRLTTLYRFAAWQHPDAAPGGFAATLHRMYEGRLPAGLGGRGRLDDDEVERWGLLMAREVIAASTRFVTTSEFAAELARLDARPEHRHRIAAVPFAFSHRSTPDRAATAVEPPVVASFGVLNRLKQGPLLVRALAASGDRASRLVFVGPAGHDDTRAVLAEAEAAGVGHRVEVTGAVDDASYHRWLQDATIAVQLRSTTNGESSAAIGDCLDAGLATVVTDIGPNRALPRDAVVPVAPSIDAVALGAVLHDLLASEDRRAAIGGAARAHARANSFAAAADALYRLVSSPG